MLQRNADTFVAHIEYHTALAGVEGCRHGDSAFPVRQRLHGVGQKIDDDLLHLLRISRQGRQPRKTDVQAIRAVLDQMGEQAQRALDRFVQLQPAEILVRAVAKMLEVVNDALDPSRAVVYVSNQRGTVRRISL